MSSLRREANCREASAEKTDAGQNHAVYDDEISPLTVVEDIAASTTAVGNQKMTDHETLRLISPFTPPLADSNEQQDGVCNDAKKSSPRHWVSCWLLHGIFVLLCLDPI